MAYEQQQSEHPLAYLDREETLDESLTSNEESNPSLEGGNTQEEQPESSKDFRKNPVFKKLTGELRESKQNYEALQAEIELLKQARTSTQEELESKEAPDYWAKLYENKEQANAAWEVMRKHDAELLRQVDVLAEEKAKQILGADTEAESRWTKHIDSELQRLEDNLEVDATSNTPQAKKIRAGIKKIWEEYSPTNENGELVLIPIEKAYDIYLKEQQLEGSTRNQARKQAASLSVARSYPTEAPLNVRPTPQPRAQSKWSKLPWRNQISKDE